MGGRGSGPPPSILPRTGRGCGRPVGAGPPGALPPRLRARFPGEGKLSSERWKVGCALAFSAFFQLFFFSPLHGLSPLASKKLDRNPASFRKRYFFFFNGFVRNYGPGGEEREKIKLISRLDRVLTGMNSCCDPLSPSQIPLVHQIHFQKDPDSGSRSHKEQQGANIYFFPNCFRPPIKEKKPNPNLANNL